jgi:hypothetical protein
MGQMDRCGIGSDRSVRRMTVTDSWRRRSIVRARQSFIPSAPREGRVMRQVRRCFIAGAGKQDRCASWLPGRIPSASVTNAGTDGACAKHCSRSPNQLDEAAGADDREFGL